jgi:hypothetical protein
LIGLSEIDVQSVELLPEPLLYGANALMVFWLVKALHKSGNYICKSLVRQVNKLLSKWLSWLWNRAHALHLS